MHLILGVTPGVNLAGYYTLFNNAGFSAPDSKDIEQWYQLAITKTNPSTSHAHHKSARLDVNLQTQAKTFFERADLPSVIIVENDQNTLFLNFLKRQCPDAHFLLLYSHPEIALADAISRGIEPRQFIGQWKLAVRELLVFQRSNRKRVILVDGEAGLISPIKLLEACAGIFEVPVQSIDESLILPATSPASLELWLSKELLSEEDNIYEMLMELEASALPISNKVISKPLSFVNIVTEYQASMLQFEHWKLEAEDLAKKLAESQAHLEESNHEIDYLLKQLAGIKKYFASELATTNASLIAERNLKNEMAQENEVLLLQLHQVQEELEYYFDAQQKFSDTNVIAKSGLPEEKQLSPSQRKKLYKEATKQKAQELFNKSWYQNFVRKPFATLNHYLRFGWKKKLSPHPLFDPVYYVESNGLSALTTCPLIHFIAFGNALGYSPHPLFDAKWYLQQYPDVKKSEMNPLLHYLNFGAKEMRNPSPTFNTAFYLNKYPDVKASGMNPLVHYVLLGKSEQRAVRA